MKREDIEYELNLLLEVTGIKARQVCNIPIEDKVRDALKNTPELMYFVRFTLQLALECQDDARRITDALVDLTENYKCESR